jgi:hypothetical protein
MPYIFLFSFVFLLKRKKYDAKIELKHGMKNKKTGKIRRRMPGCIVKRYSGKKSE